MTPRPKTMKSVLRLCAAVAIFIAASNGRLKADYDNWAPDPYCGPDAYVWEIYYGTIQYEADPTCLVGTAGPPNDYTEGRPSAENWCVNQDGGDFVANAGLYNGIPYCTCCKWIIPE